MADRVAQIRIHIDTYLYPIDVYEDTVSIRRHFPPKELVVFDRSEYQVYMPSLDTWHFESIQKLVAAYRATLGETL